MNFDDFPDAPAPKLQTEPSAQPSQPAQGGSRPLSFADFPDVGTGRQPDKDAAIMAQHPSIIPEEYRAAGRAAANSALLNLGTHAAAAYDAATSDKSYKQAFQEQKDYEHALERRNPNASMAGTATGIAGSLLVPIGPAAQLAKIPAAAVARLGGGKLLQSAAGGAGLGAGFGAAGTALENPYSPTLGQDVKTGAQTGALFGAAFGPAGEYLGNKLVGKTPGTPEADILRGQGVAPSLEMLTGEAAPKGAAADVAKEMSDKAKEVLAQKRESMITPGVSPTAGAELISEAGNKAYGASEKAYGATRGDLGELLPPDTRFTTQLVYPKSAPVQTSNSVRGHIDSAIDARLANTESLQSVPDWEKLQGFDAAKNAKSIMNKMLSGDAPLDMSRALAIKEQMNKFFNPKDSSVEKAAHQAQVQGFKDGIQNAIIDGLFTGETKNIIDNWKLGDKLFSQYRQDFFPSAGAESRIFKKAMGYMADPETGYLAKEVTPGMLQSAQGVLDDKLLGNTMGTSLYDKIIDVAGKYSPSSVDSFNASLRNQILTPKNDDLSKLPKQIRDYTSGSSLPVSLKAFGAGDGNLNSLVITKADDAATQAAKKQIADLQNYAKAIDLVYARPGTNEDKKSAVASIFKQAIFPAIGASFGVPGISDALIGAALGKGVEVGLSGPANILAARAQRTAVPSPITGKGVTTGYGTIYPGLRTSPTSLAPVPPEEPKRPVRARGGRITGPMTAKQLLDSVEAAGKKDVIATKPLLNLHDTTVANALAIANQHI